MVCNIEINNAPKVDPHYPFWVVNNVGEDGIWYFGRWKTQEEANNIIKQCVNNYGDHSKFVVEVI